MPRTGDQRVLIRVKRSMVRVGDDGDVRGAWRPRIVDVARTPQLGAGPMAIHAEPPTVTPARGLLPYPTDYKTWKILAWTGPVFLFAVFCLWGILAGNMPPFPASATPIEVKQHFQEFRPRLLIALSICLTMTAFYMSFSVATARVMERIEGPGG